MKINSRFNKIYILESLPEMHLSTGKRLYEDTIAWKGLTIDDLNCELFQPKGINDFFETIEKIYQEVKNWTYPLLHIEAHGSRDGLKIASGDVIEWESLRETLTKINISCRNNLVVTMGACEGIYLFQILQPIHRAPFCALIGPKRKITAGQLENDYSAFYSELLHSFNGNSALSKLNSNSKGENIYSFLGCNYLFSTVYANYHRGLCKGIGSKKRIERLVTETKKDLKGKGLQLKEIRGRIKHQIKGRQKEYFEQYKNHFFMIDLFPENESRFDISFDEVISNKALLIK